MKICGIICEFNPFHNGHEYLISKAKELGMPILCLMSGNFVQRGEIAILDKYSRAQSAICAGASLLAELPTAYAISSAPNFAKGSIKVLKSLKVTDIVVGATCTDQAVYKTFADILNNSKLQASLEKQLEKGNNYSQTIINLISAKTDAGDFFKDPSNILALEYYRQICAQNAKITMHFVKRTDGGYTAKTPKNSFANATTIRALAKTDIVAANKYVPKYAKLQNFKTSSLDALFVHTIRQSNIQKLSKLYDYNPSVAGLIYNNFKKYGTLAQATNACVTKTYSIKHINRLILYANFNLTKQKYNAIISGRQVCRVLAIKKEAKILINYINNSKVILVACNNHTKKLSKAQQLSLALDNYASNIYYLYSQKPHNQDNYTGTIFI